MKPKKMALYFPIVPTMGKLKLGIGYCVKFKTASKKKVQKKTPCSILKMLWLLERVKKLKATFGQEASQDNKNKPPRGRNSTTMKKLTAQQDYDRHIRLSEAWNYIVHNQDLDAENEYNVREAKHFDYCLGVGEQLPNQGKEYYARSPYSSIEVCGSGYILYNHVTGKSFPFATYKAACMARSGVSGRYQSINMGDTPATNPAGV